MEQSRPEVPLEIVYYYLVKGSELWPNLARVLQNNCYIATDTSSNNIATICKLIDPTKCWWKIQTVPGSGVEIHSHSKNNLFVTCFLPTILIFCYSIHIPGQRLDN